MSWLQFQSFLICSFFVIKLTVSGVRRTTLSHREKKMEILVKKLYPFKCHNLFFKGPIGDRGSKMEILI